MSQDGVTQGGKLQASTHRDLDRRQDFACFPWPDGDETVYRKGKAMGGLSGKLLTLSTTAGERLALVPRAKSPPLRPCSKCNFSSRDPQAIIVFL